MPDMGQIPLTKLSGCWSVVMNGGLNEQSELSCPLLYQGSWDKKCYMGKSNSNPWKAETVANTNIAAHSLEDRTPPAPPYKGGEPLSLRSLDCIAPRATDN
jgi:hypothetical protein